jgi:tetratricopeptide (TPR) repeat protein
MDVLLGYSISSKSVDDIVKNMQSLIKEGKFDEAISEAEKALIRYPANFKIINNAAQTYYVASALGENGEQRERTIELFELALKYLSQNTDPDESEFAIRMKIAELKSVDSPEEALEEFQRINYLGIADIHIAMVQMNHGQPQEALERYTKVLVNVLIRSLQLAGNMSIGLMQSGKKKNIKEAVELLDWCIAMFDGVSNGKVSYLTKMKVAMLMIRSMCYANLGDLENMRGSVDEAYAVALAFDKDPTNNIDGRIKFWHAGKDYKPALYDQLGQSAVEGIDSIFIQDDYDLPDEVLQKIELAKAYWDSIKPSGTPRA